MSIISLLIVLAVIGFCLWLFNTYVPMDSKVKKIINVVIVILIIVWLLNIFGVIGVLPTLQLH